MSVSSPTVVKRTTLHAVPKPTPRPIVSGRAAYRLAQAQGRAFEDIAADRDASDALCVGTAIDQRRDDHIRQGLRLVRLARRDRVNSESYLTLADGHLAEAIRLDRIKDEHDGRAAGAITASMEHGRAVVAAHEELLTGREAS